MVFKKTLFALVLAIPFIQALPTERAADSSCDFLAPIAKDLLDNLFENECGDAAHGALRLVFHDAIGISPTKGGGGADGSILTFNATELTFEANDGIDDVLEAVGPFYLKYADVLSPGDFVQLAGALSLAACPGAPQVKFVMGRPQPTAASPPDLVPEPFDSVDSILARFADVGFSPDEVIALLASHSVAGADTVDPSIPGTPFDSTPDTFDTNIYIDVLLKGTVFPGQSGHQGEVMSAINGTMRLQSDSELARDSRTSCTWQSFATNHDSMTQSFAAALFKLSVLGQNANELTDCSAIIPQPPALNDVPVFPPGQFLADVEQSCAQTPFPNLDTQPGAPLDVPPIPQAAS